MPTDEKLRIQALLRERFIVRQDDPHLVFGDDRPPADFNEPFVIISELLRDLPETVPERIRRSFCCLVRSIIPAMNAGGTLRFDYWDHKKAREYLPFAWNHTESAYFINAMTQYGWITKNSHIRESDSDIGITPEGWEKFHELTGVHPDNQNPAFVAMWFGAARDDSEDRTQEMGDLFEKIIKPACRKAGWRAERSDTPDYNSAVMDRISVSIRKAPFIIAELTENNPGVYYEAGLAKGLGREVIYCCPKGSKPHFDVSGLNLVMWEENEDLAEKLEARILNSIGEGPFPDKG